MLWRATVGVLGLLDGLNDADAARAGVGESAASSSGFTPLSHARRRDTVRVGAEDRPRHAPPQCRPLAVARVALVDPREAKVRHVEERDRYHIRRAAGVDGVVLDAGVLQEHLPGGEGADPALAAGDPLAE